MSFKKIQLTSLCVMVLAASPLSAVELVVVVSTKSPASSLTVEQAADIFLGRSQALPGGSLVSPIDQAEGSAVRADFYTKVADKNAAQLKAYWSKLIFTGRGRPPKESRDDAAVKAMIESNPNAIGYIDKAALDGSVKALLTIK